MTLDQARDAFQENKCFATAAEFIMKAAEYWGDGMIHDNTFASIVKECASHM